MNKVILIGRLTADPEVRYTQEQKAVANYNLAVDRRTSKTEQTADFIHCIAFEKRAEFAEKYLRKGMKIAVEGRIQTGSYTNREGRKVYTTDVIIEQQEFCESKGTQSEPTTAPNPAPANDGYMEIPDAMGDELPFA